MLNPNGANIYSAGLTEFAELIYDIVVRGSKGKPVSKQWDTAYKALLILDSLETADYLGEDANVLYDCLVALLNIYDTSGYPTPIQPVAVTSNQGPPGPKGNDGDPGQDGVDGTDGVSIEFLGAFATAPVSPTLNQAYRDTVLKATYVWDGTVWQLMNIDGADGSNGSNGADGQDGQDGNDGSTILSGSVDPTTEGNDGDFYINTTTWQIFGPKFSGAWGSGIDIIGADGTNGTNGSDGADGATGSDGAAGADGEDAYMYVAYADDEFGTGYILVSSNDNTASLSAFNSNKKFIALYLTDTAIGATITVTTFTGLWAKYAGDGDRWSTSSTTTLTIGTGIQTLSVELSLAYVTGQRTVIALESSPHNRMEGYVVSYNPATGQLVIDVDDTEGSGTYNIWDVSLQTSLPNATETPFINSDVDIGTEDVDTFSTSLASRIEWEYIITKGSNARGGVITSFINGTTVSSNDVSAADIGTVDVDLDVDISAGNIRLRATATSDDWTVKGLRRIIST
jgi:hypothetical protein